MAQARTASFTVLADRPESDAGSGQDDAVPVRDGDLTGALVDDAALSGSPRSPDDHLAQTDGPGDTPQPQEARAGQSEDAGARVEGQEGDSKSDSIANADDAASTGEATTAETGADAAAPGTESLGAPEPGVADAEPEGNEPPAAATATACAESHEATPISSEDMAPPQPVIASNVPRDQVWGQDRPGDEGKSVAALSELIESVTMPASETEDQEPEMTVVTESAEPTEVLEPAADRGAAEWGSDATSADIDPDQMEELPSDRPVPADAIRRASEALDAAVNAAPAVLGPPTPVDDDESVVLVDAEFTHFDGETEPESEPEDAASDYSGRVTDPIPVQGLSAPGVSRETSGSAQTPNGTQQPTGGPHGGDDERRSALIATVPAVDDTTPVAAELAMDARRRIELQGRKFPRPPKTRIITVANQKGGVGKTTTTVNVAAGLAQSGLNVLVIDNDPQGNASTALGIEHRAGTPSVYEILVEGESLASTIQQCPDVPNLWGVPATIDLSGSEIELVSLVSRETRLRKAIDKYLADRVAAGEERIDYVLIDCPPSLGLLTVNAFVAGREVFIPIQCEYYALEGLSQLLKTIDLIRSHLNPELRVSSILLTMYDGRTNLAQQVAGEVRSHFPAETFKTTIPRSVRISEAPSYGQTVMTYDATSTGALAYLQASRELAERGQGGSSPRRAMQAEPVGAQD
ncbi:AAA family ATPase [Promicromonospora sp. NFX87]|uniref:AAA family ATPase n=1 Tax=Promicromonospora sp. NFX87 TaxID=3402691 RepID=UPI003AFA0465